MDFYWRLEFGIRDFLCCLIRERDLFSTVSEVKESSRRRRPTVLVCHSGYGGVN